MIIVMKADILPESPEVAEVIRLAERYPDVQRRGAQDRRGDARAHRDLPARIDQHAAAGAVRGVSGRREGHPHPRALPLDRPARRPGRSPRLRVQRRALQPGRLPHLPRSVRRRHARERRGDVPRAQGRRHRRPRVPARTSRAPARTISRATARPACRTCSSWPASTASRSSPWRSRTSRTSTRSARRWPRRGNATGVMLQIGTRNAQNFELLKAVGQQQEFPVLFKRGMGITLDESLNACEYVANSGNNRIIFCLRGMKTQPRRSASQPRRLRPRAGGAAADAPAGVHRSVALGRQEGRRPRRHSRHRARHRAGHHRRRQHGARRLPSASPSKRCATARRRCCSTSWSTSCATRSWCARPTWSAARCAQPCSGGAR